MRASRVFVAAVVMVGIFACWLMTAQAGPSAWPANKGEVCLLNTTTGEMARFAVVRSVGNHYSVHGYVTEASGSQSLFDGNAILEGDLVLMHVSSSGFEEPALETHGSVGRVELDAATLNGRVMVVSFHCEGDPTLDDCAFGNDGIQVLEPIACP